MSNSYRIQAERRASLSRPHVPAARTAARTLLELPPWGYGSGRPVLSTPTTMINSTQRLFRARTRSASRAQQTNSCCETGLAAQPAAARCPGFENGGTSNWSNSTTYGREGAELGVVVELKSTESPAEKNTPNEISGNTTNIVATATPTQHPHKQEAVHSVGDSMVTGGGPVVSSSMETWTTYDGTSSSPHVQSTVSSPHNLVTPKLNSISNTPTSPPQSAASWSRRFSPTSPTSVTSGTPLDMMLATDLTNRKTNATSALNTAASPSSDVTGSPKFITPTTQPTANEPVTVVSRELIPTPLSSTDRSHEQKRVASSANVSSASEEVLAGTPVSVNSSTNGKGSALGRVSSRTEPTQSPSTTSKANDQDKSSLMVGLVKVKSRHTGLMIDCPILETLYQNEDIKSSSTAVRQSSSHKVVLIKAVVPRWAWNGRGQFTPDSSTPMSPSSTRTTDRLIVDSSVNKRKSLVSVNTQTSDTLLPVRRTISEHRSMPPSPIPVVDTHMYVPALQDECQLIPSPKLSACFARCKSTPRTPTERNLRSPTSANRLPSLPNSTSCPSSARAQSMNLISAETPNPVTSPVLHDNMPAMSEMPKESESMERPPASMEYDSLMEDAIENLKLDLQLSSSGNNSDSESVANEKTAVKRSSAERCNRSSSSSSDDMASSGQGLPTLNWSCAASAGATSSEALVNLKTSGNIDGTAVCIGQLQSSPYQKPTSAGRSLFTPPPSQRRSPASNLGSGRPRTDDSARRRSDSKCQSSPKNSNRSDTKARSTPDSCSRSKRSPCPWRSSTSNGVEQENWPGRDLSCQDGHLYEHQQQRQYPSSQQHNSSTTQYASRSDSSLSDRSKSTNLDCYEMTKKTSLTMSPGSPHTEQSSMPPPSQLATSGGSDTCATEPLDVNVHHRQHHHHQHHHHHYRATDNFRSNAADGVKSSAQHSRHNHRRSTPVKKNHDLEPKSQIQERYKVSPSGTKRSGDRQRKQSTEATRCGEVAQSSHSTGSMVVPRNAATTKRLHSSSASRHMSRDASANKRSPARDMARDRRASSSREQYCSIGDIQRRSHAHSGKHSAFDRSDKKTTSSGRRQRRHSPSISASVSKSAGSVSRGRGRPQSAHANYSTSAQSNSYQPKRPDNRPSRRRDDHESNTSFYECHQPVVYCSPRSRKPFPPPISDRYPSSSFDHSAAAVVRTSLDAEPVQYVFVQRQEDNDYGEDQPGARDGCPPPPRRQDHLYRLTQASVDKPGHQRRGNAATVGVGGRRRKKLPATQVVDGQGWCAEPELSVHIAVPSIIERPAWR